MNQKKPRGFLNEAVWPNRITVRQDAISDSYAVETRPFARGKFATVRRCRHIESGRDFAAKYLRKQRRAEDVRHELIHEALVLALADDCGRIISLKEIFETRTEVILVLEMAAGGELQHVLDAEDCLPERSVQKLLLQIAEGLAFLHSQHIAHLDIKPANLLLSSAWPQVDAKLCDFGISRLILPGEEIHEIAGTPDYIAPEVLQYEPISLATDMWSLGILTYVLLTGHTPFGGDTKQDTYCNITLGELDFPQDLFEDVTSEAVHFITQLVVKDPKKRLTIGEVLKHPWLTQPSSNPSSMTISPVIGVTTDSAEYLLTNNCANITNINNINKSASCGLPNTGEPANLQQGQPLCPAPAVQCETPSSSSMASLEESDAEITMEDQRQREPQIGNGSYTSGKRSPSVNGNSGSMNHRSNGGAMVMQPIQAAPSKGALSVNEVVETHGDLAADASNSITDNGVQLEHSQTAEQLVEVHDSSEEERVSVLDSASPAPDEELPSLQSSTSSSSSDSPVPAKKDKECEARPPKEAPKPRKASPPAAPSKGTTSAFGLSPSRAFQPPPVDYPSSLSPQVSPTLRGVAQPYSSRLPSMRPLTRSTSVSPVRTVLPSKTPLAPSKSLSNALTPHQTTSFKYNTPQAPPQSAMPTANGRRTASSSASHTPSALPRRTPSSSLKRPQPAPAPKLPKTTPCGHDTPSHAHATTTHSSAATHKASPTPRPSLLSPTVSSALKSSAVPLRTVNSLSRGDCEVHGNQHHRRSLVLTSAHAHPVAQENKSAPIAGANKRGSAPERSLRKPIKTTTPASLNAPGAAVVRRSSVMLDRTKTAAARKSMDLEGLRRKAFTDDMLVC